MGNTIKRTINRSPSGPSNTGQCNLKGGTLKGSIADPKPQDFWFHPDLKLLSMGGLDVLPASMGFSLASLASSNLLNTRR